MTEEDGYKTITHPAEGLFKEKGSKFFAFAIPVFSEDEFKKKLEEIKKAHHSARHHCYAYRIGALETETRMNDDGEPSGTAGKPIFGQILSYELFDAAIIVVRYFGGTKLGVGGLIQAYKKASILAVENANIIEKTIDHYYSVQCGYPLVDEILRTIDALNAKIIDQRFTEDCKLEIAIRKSKSEILENALNKIYGLKYKYLETK